MIRLRPNNAYTQYAIFVFYEYNPFPPQLSAARACAEQVKQTAKKTGPHAKRSVFGSEFEVTWLPLRRRELRPS